MEPLRCCPNTFKHPAAQGRNGRTEVQYLWPAVYMDADSLAAATAERMTERHIGFCCK